MRGRSVTAQYLAGVAARDTFAKVGIGGTMTRDGESIRQRRTRVQIKRALHELVLEMEPGKITVKAIADRALINRKTFYLYYDSIEALLFEELEETIVRFFAEVEETPDDLEDFAGHAKRSFIFLARQDESTVRLVMRKTPLERGDRALLNSGYSLKRSLCVPVRTSVSTMMSSVSL